MHIIFIYGDRERFKFNILVIRSQPNGYLTVSPFNGDHCHGMASKEAPQVESILKIK